MSGGGGGDQEVTPHFTKSGVMTHKRFTERMKVKLSRCDHDPGLVRAPLHQASVFQGSVVHKGPLVLLAADSFILKAVVRGSWLPPPPIIHCNVNLVLRTNGWFCVCFWFPSCFCSFNSFLFFRLLHLRFLLLPFGLFCRRRFPTQPVVHQHGPDGSVGEGLQPGCQ